MTNFENSDSELSSSEREILKKKLNSIIAQKAEITCKSIKFSVKLMTKLSKYLAEEKDKNLKPATETLMKLKIFLKITRLIIDNSKFSMENSSQKQTEFFKM